MLMLIDKWLNNTKIKIPKFCIAVNVCIRQFVWIDWINTLYVTAFNSIGLPTQDKLFVLSRYKKCNFMHE